MTIATRYHCGLCPDRIRRLKRAKSPDVISHSVQLFMRGMCLATSLPMRKMTPPTSAVLNSGEIGSGVARGGLGGQLHPLF